MLSSMNAWNKVRISTSVLDPVSDLVLDLVSFRSKVESQFWMWFMFKTKSESQFWICFCPKPNLSLGLGFGIV